MVRRVAFVSLLSLCVSCGLFGKKGSGDGDDPAPPGPTTNEVTPTGDTDGAVTGSFSAGSKTSTALPEDATGASAPISDIEGLRPW